MIRTGRRWLLFVWLLGMLISPRAIAARSGLPEIFVPVTDLAGVLPEEAEARISQRLEEHRAATRVQIAVLTIDTTRGVPIEDYALQVATQWGGGSGDVDDGALLVLAVDDRQMRLELGYGLEAQIPDAQARRLLDAAIPHLRANDYANATHTIVEGVIGMTGGTSRAEETIAVSPVDPMESWTPDVRIESPPPRFSSPLRPPFELGFAGSGLLVVVVGIGLAFLGVILRQAADAQQLAEKAMREPEEEAIDHWEMPPIGWRVGLLLGVAAAVGAIAFVLDQGVGGLFAGLAGATVGYLFIPLLRHTNAFSGTGTTSGSSSFRSSSSSSFGSSFGRSSSFGSSIGRSSSGGSSRSWSGGGGRFGGGGASSRW